MSDCMKLSNQTNIFASFVVTCSFAFCFVLHRDNSRGVSNKAYETQITNTLSLNEGCEFFGGLLTLIKILSFCNQLQLSYVKEDREILLI